MLQNRKTDGELLMAVNFLEVVNGLVSQNQNNGNLFELIASLRPQVGAPTSPLTRNVNVMSPVGTTETQALPDAPSQFPLDFPNQQDIPVDANTAVSAAVQQDMMANADKCVKKRRRKMNPTNLCAVKRACKRTNAFMTAVAGTVKVVQDMAAKPTTRRAPARKKKCGC